MKKLTRVVLSICVTAILIGCMSVSAFAASTSDYFEYTVQSGDTVYAICRAIGVDFDANQNWITAVNNITNYRDIKVGKRLILPLFDTRQDPNKAAALQAALSGTTTVSTVTIGGVTTPIAATTTTVAPTALGGDKIVAYLINHVMQPGETVFSVCNALGVDFNSNADKIMKLSGITSWNKVAAGKTVVIPSTSPSGTNYTAIVAHKVAGGETVGSICNSYNVNFAKSQEQLKALNSTQNLNVIKVGQTFYLPVSGGTVTTMVAGTPIGGTTPATTGGVATTTVPVTTPAVATSQIGVQNVPHGSFVLQVDGVNVTSASTGQVVKIVPMPEAGYKVSSVTVLKNNGSVSVPVTGMTFVMPESAITVNVTFTKA
ncbi:MAG: LysM peptidoglycan-binding domain-containing protein [Oscillospiraceae bacterium]|nr:LysM peptidoglycan-binding domain-containing protein [Oscillospiraceae bacterium]